jgi:hypothetical protein
MAIIAAAIMGFIIGFIIGFDMMLFIIAGLLGMFHIFCGFMAAALDPPPLPEAALWLVWSEWPLMCVPDPAPAAAVGCADGVVGFAPRKLSLLLLARN